jgi:hypothetical protein
MKRRRRPTPVALLRIEANLYGGEVIPPRSVIVANEKNVASFGNDQYRIGYYRKSDGLDCVWLVNRQGEYEQTADQRFIRRNFRVLKRSDETDLYGKNRPEIAPFESAP